MENKEIKNGFLFGYGEKNFGEEISLSEKFDVDLKNSECVALAIIKGKHTEEFVGKLELTFTAENAINLTIEQKNKSNGALQIVSQESYDFCSYTHKLFLNLTEKNDIQELVFAFHKHKNTKYKQKNKVKIELKSI